MLRLISIEYFKLKNTRYFWVLSVLFLIFMIAVPLAGRILINYLDSLGHEFNGLSVSDIPLFDFVDIWQNLTWIYKGFSILLGFITIISVTGEFTHTTLRQSIIDGWSRQEFLRSKIGMIFTLSAFFSVVALVIGLISGYLWSPVTDIDFVMKNIGFIPAYFLHLLAFQLFCLFIALIIKKSGMTIALMIFYVYVIEPLTYGFLFFKFGYEKLAEWLPITAMGNLIRLPFAKYGLQYTQTFVSTYDILVVIFYIVVLSLGSYYMLSRRDV